MFADISIACCIGLSMCGVNARSYRNSVFKFAYSLLFFLNMLHILFQVKKKIDYLQKIQWRSTMLHGRYLKIIQVMSGTGTGTKSPSPKLNNAKNVGKITGKMYLNFTRPKVFHHLSFYFFPKMKKCNCWDSMHLFFNSSTKTMCT